jgi:hypothetical protein
MTIQLNGLHWFGHVQGMEENRIPKEKSIIYEFGNKKTER